MMLKKCINGYLSWSEHISVLSPPMLLKGGGDERFEVSPTRSLNDIEQTTPNSDSGAGKCDLRLHRLAIQHTSKGRQNYVA